MNSFTNTEYRVENIRKNTLNLKIDHCLIKITAKIKTLLAGQLTISNQNKKT